MSGSRDDVLAYRGCDAQEQLPRLKRNTLGFAQSGQLLRRAFQVPVTRSDVSDAKPPPAVRKSRRDVISEASDESALLRTRDAEDDVDGNARRHQQDRRQRGGGAELAIEHRQLDPHRHRHRSAHVRMGRAEERFTRTGNGAMARAAATRAALQA